ncbi:MAG: molybdenum cofactor biosynthesis protein, partial [Acetobacteraceae bacterium]|nr:molybdenum cofactor biosynthesis protein [Acetobacteraceae bacterium]
MTQLPAPGGRLVETLPFKQVRIAVLTVSDTRDEESDTSGKLLADRVADAGHQLAGRALVPDEIHAIRQQVRAWVDGGEVDTIVTTGGTGLTGRD